MRTSNDLKIMLDGCKTEEDVKVFVRACMEYLERYNGKIGEQARDEVKSTLLEAIILYLVEIKPEHLTFEMVLDTLSLFPIVNNKDGKDAMSNLFGNHQKKDSNSKAVELYEIFRNYPSSTKYTTAVSLISELEEHFNS